MQLSDLPARFPIPFADSAGSGYIRPIPTNHVAATGTDAPASLHDGFPPETFTPLSSGGIPPSGQDVNGLFNQLTAWARWSQAGGSIPYNATFQTAIGGYMLSSVVESATTPGLQYRSTVDNNMTDPDAGGAGWTAVYPNALASGSNGNGKWRRYPIGGGSFELAQRGKLVGPITGEQVISVTFPTPFASAPDIEGFNTNVWIASSQIFADIAAQVIESTITTTGFSIQMQQEGTVSYTVQGVLWSVVGIYTP